MDNIEWIGHSDRHIFYTKVNSSYLKNNDVKSPYKLFEGQTFYSTGYTVEEIFGSVHDKKPIRYDFNISRELYKFNFNDSSNEKLLGNENIVITDHHKRYSSLSDKVSDVRTPIWSFVQDGDWLYGYVNGSYPENNNENAYNFKMKIDGKQFGIISTKARNPSVDDVKFHKINRRSFNQFKYKGYYYFGDDYSVKRVNENMEYVIDDDGFPRYVINFESVFERSNIPRGGTGNVEMLFFHDDWLYFIVRKLANGNIKGAPNYRGGFSEIYRVEVNTKRVHQIGTTRKDTFYGIPFKVAQNWLYFLPSRDFSTGCRIHLQTNKLESLEFPRWSQTDYNAADHLHGYRYIGGTIISFHYRGYYIHDSNGKVMNEVVRPRNDNNYSIYSWHNDTMMMELYQNKLDEKFYLEYFEVKNRRIKTISLNL